MQGTAPDSRFSCQDCAECRGRRRLHTDAIGSIRQTILTTRFVQPRLIGDACATNRNSIALELNQSARDKGNPVRQQTAVRDSPRATEGGPLEIKKEDHRDEKYPPEGRDPRRLCRNRSAALAGRGNLLRAADRVRGQHRNGLPEPQNAG